MRLGNVRAGDLAEAMQGEIGEIVAHTTGLESLHGGAFHMGAPLSFAFPHLDEDANAAVVERLVQLVTQAAVFNERFGDQLPWAAPSAASLPGLAVVIAMMVRGDWDIGRPLSGEGVNEAAFDAEGRAVGGGRAGAGEIGARLAISSASTMRWSSEANGAWRRTRLRSA